MAKVTLDVYEDHVLLLTGILEEAVRQGENALPETEARAVEDPCFATRQALAHLRNDIGALRYYIRILQGG